MKKLLLLYTIFGFSIVNAQSLIVSNLTGQDITFIGYEFNFSDCFKEAQSLHFRDNVLFKDGWVKFEYNQTGQCTKSKKVELTTFGGMGNLFTYHPDNPANSRVGIVSLSIFIPT